MCRLCARRGGLRPGLRRGPRFAPPIEAASRLVETLTNRSKPLHLDDAGRRPDEARLGPFDRAALATLETEVVVPVRRDAALSAFICLGPKRSGDVYTTTDISHLAAVADAMARELRRFHQDESMQAARAMHESLRR